MIASQTTAKIQRGLKFTDVHEIPSKVIKREKPGHKSFKFSSNF